MLALCLVAALLLAAYKPARGAASGTEKCTASKISATGKYALCRLQAEANAERTGTSADFGKCAAKHTRAFERTEAKYGADCLTVGEAAAIQNAMAAQATRLSCFLKGLSDGGSPSGAAIVSVPGIQVTQTADPTLTVANLSNAALIAYCILVDADASCLTRDFFVSVPAQSAVSWLAGVGIQSQIPPMTAPFSGEMVCLQVDAADLSAGPTFGANLAASVTPPGDCPRDGIGIAVGSTNNGDAILNLGGGEYGPCPASIGAARIENCWSKSLFTFECN